MRLRLAVIAALALPLLASPPLGAHGDADWINRGLYKNAAGELCCGERDCAIVPTEDIAVTAAGYVVKSLRETIPFAEAQPSPDGAYWRCQWGGERKCFFAPPPNT